MSFFNITYYRYLFCLLFLLCIVNIQAKTFKVVLDAGHGGKDPGNTGNGYKEKEIALEVALRVGEILTREEIDVVYTRKTDDFVELRDRAKIANKTKADLFVSIHCNAHQSNAKGPETYVLGLHAAGANFDIAKKENSVIFLEENHGEKYKGFNPNAPEYGIGITLQQEENLKESIVLADLIQRSITVTSKEKRPDRSVRQAGFWVLHNTVMPSILVELGFLTNKEEGAYLNSRKGRKEMAEKIANAIETYLTVKEKEQKELDAQPQAKVQQTPYMDDNLVSTPKSEPTTNSVNTGDFPLSKSSENNAKIPPTAYPLSRAPIISSSKDAAQVLLQYKVQLASYVHNFSVTDSIFKGFKGISKTKKNDAYNYFYCETADLQKAQKCRQAAKNVGFTSAYIVRSYDIPGLSIALDKEKDIQPIDTSKLRKGEMLIVNQRELSIEKNGPRISMAKRIENNQQNKITSKPRKYYAVQILATVAKPNLKNSSFKDLKKLQIMKVEGLYKYVYGQSTTYQQALEDKKFLRSKGYEDCFIITVDEEIK